MTLYNTCYTAPFKARDLFGLIKDVPSYPLFLSWIRQSNVFDHQVVATGEQFSADLHVIIPETPFSFSYTSSVGAFYLPDETYKVTMSSNSGPFNFLIGAWTLISKSPRDTEINLYLEFDLINKGLEIFVNALTHKITKNIIALFVEEAQKRFIECN